MIIEYEGKSYEFDFGDISVRQAIKIEEYLGISFDEWTEKVAKGGNLKVIQAAGWLILEGGDLDLPIEECDFKLMKLGAGFAKANAMQAKKRTPARGAKPGPTAAATSSAPKDQSQEDPSPVSLAAGS